MNVFTYETRSKSWDRTVLADWANEEDRPSKTKTANGSTTHSRRLKRSLVQLWLCQIAMILALHGAGGRQKPCLPPASDQLSRSGRRLERPGLNVLRGG